MDFSFDRVWNRRRTNCIKWDFNGTIFGKDDILPLWVADMDFAVPPPVQEDIQNRAGHPIYGYSGCPPEFFHSFINWNKKRHGWLLEKDWIMATPGVVPSIALAINALTQEGNGIIIQPPVYPPFFSIVEKNQRKLQLNPLRRSGNSYKMDFDNLEQNIDENTRMLILCHPHNPGGRVWKKEELQELIRLCAEHNIIVVSDEIWADIVFSGNKHIPLAKAAPEFKDNIITCMAASKTFNLAGLKASATVIPDEYKRKKFQEAMDRLNMGRINIFGMTSFISAFYKGEEWLECLLDYLEGNLEFLLDFIQTRLPGVRAIPPQGTFLVWLDFNSYGLSDEELREKTVNGARVGLNPGYTFGEEGRGFQRINIGCPRETLKEALERLAQEFE